jgi:hypothetical protein
MKSTNVSSQHLVAVTARRGAKQSAKKLRAQQLRTVANSYLSHIALDGFLDSDYYEKVLAEPFDRFLAFNRIAARRANQSEYFNYYKQRLVSEREQARPPPPDRRSELERFLASEFRSENSDFQAGAYIRTIVESGRHQTSHSRVPAIHVVPGATFTDRRDDRRALATNTSLTADLELGYIQAETVALSSSAAAKTNPIQQAAVSNVTLSSSSSVVSTTRQSSSSHKLAHSLNSALLSVSSKLHKQRAPSPSDETLLAGERQPPLGESRRRRSAQARRRPHTRTISESSSESAFHSVLFHHKTASGNNASSTVCNAQTSRCVTGYKPSLFGNLRKLNNEKLVFTSNNAPLGMFSRLPFRLQNIK